MIQQEADPVQKLSIIPRGRVLGVARSTPEQDLYGYDADYLPGRIIGDRGGSAAEALIFGVTSSGAENDLENASGTARQMVGRCWMSDHLGPVSLLPPEGDPRTAGVSDNLLDAIDQEVRRIIDECARRADGLLEENRVVSTTSASSSSPTRPSPGRRPMQRPASREYSPS